jgi:predicted cupin superfamily sugar epimerase
MITSEQLIAALDLKPLPLEGGYYRETYRSSLQLPASALAPDYPSAKSAGTAIYYLLKADTCSALHRLPTDEIFHFYLGDPVEILLLEPGGCGRTVTLGPDVLAGQSPQIVVPHGVWQGSALKPGGRFALLGTTMAPGFDFADYQAGNRDELIAAYPVFVERIVQLCP